MDEYKEEVAVKAEGKMDTYEKIYGKSGSNDGKTDYKALKFDS